MAPYLSAIVGVACVLLLLSGKAPGQEAQRVPVEDSYSSTPFETSYAARRKAYLEFETRSPVDGPYTDAARISLGQSPNEASLNATLERIDSRPDCADFQLHGILRLLHQFGDSPLLSEAFRLRARTTVLNFKYWPDEPGIDSMCTWSENHFILFASGGYLAGQLYPNEVFANSGQTGREKMSICRPRILRWLDLRFRSGFSEWLSNVYYEEDLAALLNLADFCADDEIRQRATMVTDVLVADMALNTFRGALGSTHGRTYEHQKKKADTENTASMSKVLFGMNKFRAGNMGAASLALSPRYRLPRVLYEIAADLEQPEMVNKQRAGIRVRDAATWGLDPQRLEDGMSFLGLEAYSDPRTVNVMMRMMDEYHWWGNRFFAPLAKRRRLLITLHRLHALPLVAWCWRHDVQRGQREEANIYTYRTPDYMLSTAQDYRPGYGGDQQHVWQATLGPGAVCFTTHPYRQEQNKETPNYWAGSGTLPRVAQVKNVVIALYRVSTMRGLFLTNNLLLTHAWLPKDQFDEFIERDGWFFARRGDAYLALWSRESYHWQTEDGEDKDREIVAQGTDNIWICELGRRAVDGDFAAFMDRIARARLSFNGLQVAYASPSQGTLEFGWYGSLRQNGSIIELANYPRYDNPYVQANFPGGTMAFRCNGQSLELDWATLRREASANGDD